MAALRNEASLDLFLAKPAAIGVTPGVDLLAMASLRLLSSHYNLLLFLSL